MKTSDANYGKKRGESIPSPEHPTPPVWFAKKTQFASSIDN